MDLEQLARDAIEWMRQAPTLPALFALFVASFLEYVAPPVPGDTLILAGGIFAAQGVFPLAATLFATTTGSVAGSAAAWWIGRLATKSARLHRIFTRFVRPERLEQLTVAYRKKGRWFVLGNRFFPGVRATFLFVAGYAHVPLREILLYGSLSALGWNTLLVLFGYAVGLNLERLFALMGTYTAAAWATVLFVVLVLVGRALWRRRQKR